MTRTPRLPKQELLRFMRGQLRSALRRKRRSSWLVGGLFVAILAVSYLLHEPPAPTGAISKGARLECTVKSVYDGDTLTANCAAGQVKVRFFGIDAPEMGQKPWGEQAKQALLRLLPASGAITLQVMDQDRYGRTVAQVLVGKRDLGLELVRQGQVSVYEQYNKSAVYRQAQDAAKQAQLGIWREPGSQQNPAAWRRVSPR